MQALSLHYQLCFHLKFVGHLSARKKKKKKHKTYFYVFAFECSRILKVATIQMRGPANYLRALTFATLVFTQCSEKKCKTIIVFYSYIYYTTKTNALLKLKSKRGLLFSTVYYVCEACVCVSVLFRFSFFFFYAFKVVYS